MRRLLCKKRGGRLVRWLRKRGQLPPFSQDSNLRRLVRDVGRQKHGRQPLQHRDTDHSVKRNIAKSLMSFIQEAFSILHIKSK